MTFSSSRVDGEIFWTRTSPMSRHLPSRVEPKCAKLGRVFVRMCSQLGTQYIAWRWLVGAVDGEGRWWICKAAGIRLAGAPYLIPNMITIIIFGYLSSLFWTLFTFICLISVLWAFEFSLVLLLCGKKPTQRGIFWWQLCPGASWGGQSSLSSCLNAYTWFSN